MKIRRYIGSTTQEAMLKLKRELGSDAIVLHTRKIRKPGITGFFSKKLIEIVAAVDEEKENEKAIQSNRDNKEQNFLMRKSNFTDSNKLELNKDIDSELKKLRNAVEDIAKNFDEKKIDTLPTELVNYRIKLIENGVDAIIAENILKKIDNQVNVVNLSKEIIRDIVLNNIREYLGVPQPVIYDGNQKVIFFIGPTGVGKTTTLAKLAATFAIKNNYSVGLITADTYRIAAVEQLKIYGEILQIPLKIIYETKEIYNMLSNFIDKDIILVDTAGRNHNNIEQIDEVQKLIVTTKNKEVYLVINSTTDFTTIKAIVDQYSFIDNFKIIFSKVDEATNIGVILNTTYYSKNPLSYITIGQNVPEDIEIADVDKISRALIGELTNERPS